MVWIFVLACCYPIFKRSGERRRFIVKRGGSVLAICWRILKVSRRNYCNYYILKIVRESWFSSYPRSPKLKHLSVKTIKIWKWPLHPLGRFVGASSKLSGREHGLITHVPAQWELYLLSSSMAFMLHFLFSIHYLHPFDVRTSGSVGTWNTFPMNCVLSFS